MASCDCLQELDRLRLRHEAAPEKTHFIVIEFDDDGGGLYYWGHKVSVGDYQKGAIELSKEVLKRLEEEEE